ncbi:secretion system protein [Actinomadura darangshiensis]|uniref:Secretion system protein n=1 Tax=Actinomadura darangshiensis TaxID=705336 RepID=A0A4R5A5L0_9ACTN|nr:type II secretion system F family protein [Actinomadura darangshiensis]TDD67231.1 secretion system protein [Actinomadura darangshiensis]
MTAALVWGTGVGLGLVAIFRGLFPPKPTLAAFLSGLNRTPAALNPRHSPPVTPCAGWAARAGRPLVPVLAGVGLPGASMRADLEMLGRPAEQLLAEKATAAAAGLLLPPTAAGMVSAAGIPVSWQAPLWASLLLATAGFFVPDAAARFEAARCRAQFRQALSAFLDLVVIALAGGAGIEAALAYSASTGTGWPFDRIRQALETARLTRRPPWYSLGELGNELGISELVELASNVALAGTEGAKVRASLATKAAALRTHQLADAEAKAQAATERLSLPVVLLFAGFLILLGYPAFAHVITDF